MRSNVNGQFLQVEKRMGQGRVPVSLCLACWNQGVEAHCSRSTRLCDIGEGADGAEVQERVWTFSNKTTEQPTKKASHFPVL